MRSRRLAVCIVCLFLVLTLVGIPATAQKKKDYIKTGRISKTFEVTSPGGHGCGDKPFTARFQVDATRN